MFICSSFGSSFASSFCSFLVSSFGSSFGSSFDCSTGFSSLVFTSDFTSAFSGSAFLVSSFFGSSCGPLNNYNFLNYLCYSYLSENFQGSIEFDIIIFSFIQRLVYICPTFYFFCIFFEFWTSLISWQKKYQMKKY